MIYYIRRAAELDLDEIADYLAEHADLELALRFFEASHETFALLASQPLMGWSCRLPHHLLKSVRVFRVAPPFDQYLIFYDLDAAGIRILRVLHGAQDLESIFTAYEP